MTAMETRPDTTTDWLDKVRELEPLIAKHRKRARSSATSPSPSTRRCVRWASSRSGVPKAVGGDEADIHTALEITELLAKFDGSTAWNFMIGLQGSVLLGYVPEHQATEMMRENPTPPSAAPAMPGGVAGAVEGGYRSPGAGRSPAAPTTLAGFAQLQIEENGVTSASTRTATRAALPRGSDRPRTRWTTPGTPRGLRATGSGDIEVKDVFVPEDRFVDGQLTKSPYQDANDLPDPRRAPASAHLLRGRDRHCPRGPRSLHRPLLQRSRGARNKILAEYESARTLWPRRGEDQRLPLPPPQRDVCAPLALRRSARTATTKTWLIDALLCFRLRRPEPQRGGEMLLEAAGGTGIYRKSPLERCFRDVHMVSKHARLPGAVNYTRGGRFRLGNGFSMRRG